MPISDSQSNQAGQGLAGDRWADLWLVPRGEALRGLVADVRQAIEANEYRKRKRKPQDEATFSASLAFLIADLAVATLSDNGVSTVLPLGNAMGKGLARYGNPRIPSKTLANVLRACEALGLVHLSPGYRGTASTVRPSEAFRRDLLMRGVSLQDVGRDAGEEEVIILSRKRREELREGVRAEPKVFTERVGYADTQITHAMRQEVLALNTQLARLDLGWIEDGEPRPDINQRRLRRHFSLLPQSQTTGQPKAQSSGQHPASLWSNGGRLFGGFWDNLSRARRRASLRINGEAIIEADFSALFVRLAYGELGEELPAALQDDPYAIRGWPEGYRGGLKAALNAMLFAEGPLHRLPPDIAAEVPEGWRARDIREVILEAHPVLEKAFGTRLGFRLMRMESDMLLATMALCGKAGIPALPLHDALLVPRSRGVEAVKVMEEVGEEVTGLRLKVELKG